MSFNPNIPTISSSTLQSYRQLRANFQAINSAFAVNHGGLTQDASISGSHNVLLLRPQSGDPTTTATQIALYSKLVGGIPSLFFRPNSDQTPIQLSYPSVSTGLQSENPPVYLPQQYSFLAGPFVIYGGLIKRPNTGDTVTLSPITTLLYVGLVMANASSDLPPATPTMAIPTSISGNSFTITFGANLNDKVDVYYTAIGK